MQHTHRHAHSWLLGVDLKGTKNILKLCCLKKTYSAYVTTCVCGYNRLSWPLNYKEIIPIFQFFVHIIQWLAPFQAERKKEILNWSYLKSKSVSELKPVVDALPGEKSKSCCSVELGQKQSRLQRMKIDLNFSGFCWSLNSTSSECVFEVQSVNVTKSTRKR